MPRLAERLGQRARRAARRPSRCAPPSRTRPSSWRTMRADRGRAADADRVGGHRARASRGRTRPAARPPCRPAGRRAGRGSSRRSSTTPPRPTRAARDPVDLDAERVHVDPVGLGPDHQGRSPGPAGPRGTSSRDQAGGGQVGGERADGAAVEPERWRSARPARSARARARTAAACRGCAGGSPPGSVLRASGVSAASTGRSTSPAAGRPPARQRVDAGRQQQHRRR